MKKIKLIFFLVILNVANSFSQITWEKLFSKESTDAFRCIQEVSPGNGYVAAGYTADSTANDTDAFVVRLKADGDTLWTFSYNGPLSKKDLFYKIIITSDGGFIACGYTTSVTGTSDDVLYIKINSSGQQQWVQTYGGSGKERAQDILETTDGYTIAGYTTTPPAQYYDALLLHTDLSGAVLWSRSIGGSNYDDANSIEQLPDGGYILGGQSTVNGSNYDQFLIRTNITGDTLWTKHIGTAGTDNIECLTLVSDGFILAGGTNSLSTGDNGYLVKTDTSGSVIWTKIFGGTDQDDFHRVEKTTDGGFIVSGTVSSYGPGNPNMWLMKTDMNGDSLWARTFGGDNHDHGYSAIQTSDGGYIFSGYTGSHGFHNEDAYVVKTDDIGNVSNPLKYISAFSLASPVCSGTASEVKVVVRNFGNAPVSSIPVTVEITGGLTQTLNYVLTGPLVPQDVTTITFSPTINTIGTGPLTFYSYTGTANDVYPAQNSFTITKTLSPCIGIDEIYTASGYSFYPNPSHGNILFEFSKQFSKVEIQIVNTTGILVKQFILENTNGLKKHVDLSSLSKGIYLVEVNTGEGFDVRRMVIE